MSSTDTLVLRDAAHLLHMGPDALRKKTRAGHIPATKIGKRWIYSRPLLMEWIAERSRQNLKRNGEVGSSPCAE